VQLWYVTFHGGDDPHEWNNIHIFDLAGKPLGKALATHSLPNDTRLLELRGFAFGPDGDLYVANANKNASQVLRFDGKPGADGKHSFREVFIEQHPANPGLAHPFDVAFGPDGHLYVPSQNTNVVGRYYGPRALDGQPGQPMPHPPALREVDTKRLLPGTFVPSKRVAPYGVRSVRRAIFGPNGNLYVADRDSNSVKRYDGVSGENQREYRHHRITTPEHLAFESGERILVSSRDKHAVYAINTSTGDVSPLVEPGMGGLRAPAGLAFGPAGKLYVCSRETKQILRYDAETGKADPKPFIDGLADFPEFISLVTR